MNSDETARCPSCGTPARTGFRVDRNVKIALALLLVGYIFFSVMVFLAGTPPEMRKGCGSIDYRIQVPFFTPNYERCKETDSYLWLKSILDQPVYQVFVWGGLAAGILIFYYDWFEELRRKWKAKRVESAPEKDRRYKYKCRNCGRQWN